MRSFSIKTLALTFILSMMLMPSNVFAACVGCGGTSGGNQPCYNYGEVVSDGSWYQYTNCLDRILDVYVGGCQIKRTYWHCGVWQTVTYYSGGCTCGGITAYPGNHVLEPFDLEVEGGGQGGNGGIGVVSDKDLEAVEIYNLATGEAVSGYGAVKAGETVELALDGIGEGEAFVVAGYVDGVIQGFAPLRRSGDGVELLQRFYNWSAQEGMPVMQCVVYTNPGEVSILMQLEDGTIRVSRGSTSVGR